MVVAERPPTSSRWGDIDFTRLAAKPGSHFLRDIGDRAAARLVPFTPITPEERLKAFKELNYRPNGLFIPASEKERTVLKERVRTIGDIVFPDERLRAYHNLQRECEIWESSGMPGRWNGQQALARSRARFRIAAYGRRAGKTTEAAMEAIAVAYVRPRSWVWLAAPTMKLADRAFQKVKDQLNDLGMLKDARQVHDSAQDKFIILANGSKVEALSLDNIWSAAGAAIDFAVIDEAAQVAPEAWTRAILPPLTDRNGQALLISSWEGEGDFFQQKALDAEQDRLEHGTEAAWELFQDASYDVNFYVFPQGERTPALVQAQKEMDPIDYLEQFGAIPATSRDRVFPEFKEKVHVGEGPGYEYNPELPVDLTYDPSGGANPYAIIALQDYGDHIVIFDELYETHMSTEELAPLLVERSWCDAREVDSGDEAVKKWEISNIRNMVGDSAAPEEVRRWDKMGFPAYGVPEKPEIVDRLPLMKNWLRDPIRFRYFYRLRERDVMQQMDIDPDTDVTDLPGDVRKGIIIRVEESMSDQNMSSETRRFLKSCARIRVNRRCVNTIMEYKSYAWPKPLRLNQNYSKNPRDWMNHTMDALGYYLWDQKRFAFEKSPSGFDYLKLEILPDDDDESPVSSADVPDRTEGHNPYLAPSVRSMSSDDRAHMFTVWLRETHSLHPNEPRSYLQASGR